MVLGPKTQTYCQKYTALTSASKMTHQPLDIAILRSTIGPLLLESMMPFEKMLKPCMQN